MNDIVSRLLAENPDRHAMVDAATEIRRLRVKLAELGETRTIQRQMVKDSTAVAFNNVYLEGGHASGKTLTLNAGTKYISLPILGDCGIEFGRYEKSERKTKMEKRARAVI